MTAHDDRFAPHFSSRRVLPSDDAALMSDIHRLRFDVYCVECNFLSAQEFPERLESDLYDAASAHFCAMNLQGQLAGYVRLVPNRSDGRFPFQEHCEVLFEPRALPDPEQSCEISRLMVHSHYRRRRGDTLSGVTISSGNAPVLERRNDSPQIMLSMFRQMYAYSVSSGIRYWYAAMEQNLSRALNRLGFIFDPIGPPTDYYGPVAPYLADLRHLETIVGQAQPELLDWMREPLS